MMSLIDVSLASGFLCPAKLDDTFTLILPGILTNDFPSSGRVQCVVEGTSIQVYGPREGTVPGTVRNRALLVTGLATYI